MRCSGVSGVLLVMLLLAPPGMADSVSYARNEAAFNAGSVDELLDILGARAATPSDAIAIDLSAIDPSGSDLSAVAQDEPVAALTATSHIDGSEWIALIADNNPQPLLAFVRFFGAGVPQVSARVRLASDGEVRVLVKAADGHFITSRAIDAAPAKAPAAAPTPRGANRADRSPCSLYR